MLSSISPPQHAQHATRVQSSCQEVWTDRRARNLEPLLHRGLVVGVRRSFTVVKLISIGFVRGCRQCSAGKSARSSRRTWLRLIVRLARAEALVAAFNRMRAIPALCSGAGLDSATSTASPRAPTRSGARSRLERVRPRSTSAPGQHSQPPPNIHP